MQVKSLFVLVLSAFLKVFQGLKCKVSTAMAEIALRYNFYCIAHPRANRGDMAGSIIKMVIALYVFSSIGISAIVAVSNETAYSGADSKVITIGTVLLPMIAVLAVVMMLYNRTAGGK